MRRRKKEPPAPPPEPPKSNKPPWHDLVEQEERPNREDLGAQHNVFMDSMLEPVPLPRWLRGRRRARRDKLS